MHSMFARVVEVSTKSPEEAESEVMQNAEAGVTAPDEASHGSNGLGKHNIVYGPGMQRGGIRISRGLPHQGWSTRTKQMLYG